MIELSVLLPMFRAQYIAWLAFEGLARQEGIDFEWELVIAEEQNDETFGYDGISQYMPKLRKAGCTKVNYMTLRRWVNLGRKIQTMLLVCEPTSRIWTYNAADAYFPPRMLATQFEAFKTGDIHWFATPRTITYDIPTDRTVLHKRKIKEYKGDNAFTARSMDIARRLETTRRRHCIDGWLWQKYTRICRDEYKTNLKVGFDKTDNWKRGFNTNGLNNISHGRGGKLKNPKPPFYRCPVDLKKMIPWDVMERLRGCKRYVGIHRIGLPT